MKNKSGKMVPVLSAFVYFYLGLPTVIFLLGWCRWYFAVPVTIAGVLAAVLAVREHMESEKTEFRFEKGDWIKIIVIAIVAVLWVVLSGIGGFVWQNTEQAAWNGLYELLVAEKWPIAGFAEIDGVMRIKPFRYYIGFWLPSVLIGKTGGIEAGYIAQFFWALFGILLFYAMICVWRKRVVIWPLVLLIFFSGLDVVGMLLNQVDGVSIFGTLYLERWAPELADFQYSSMTTQLFRMYHQAIPAWVACAFVFLFEKPRNMLFTISMLILPAVFPFAGLAPFAVFFMIRRGKWNTDHTKVVLVLRGAARNWVSWQNIVAGVCIGLTGSLFVCSNGASGDSSELPEQITLGGILLVIAGLAVLCALIVGIIKIMLAGGGKWLALGSVIAGIVILIRLVSGYPCEEWQSPIFWWINISFFYLLEAGVYFICLYPFAEERVLFGLNAVVLYFIPLLRAKEYADFCMGASVPGLLLIALWCIKAIDEKKNVLRVYCLAGLLVLGAITPLHEWKRVYVNTKNPYENSVWSSEMLFEDTAGKFIGDMDSFFVKHIAKKY